MVMHVKPENLRGAANICSDGGKHPLAAMFGADESHRGGSLAIYCLFYNKEKRSLDTLKAEFPKEGPFSYPCLTNILPAAAWYEREINKLGIEVKFNTKKFCIFFFTKSYFHFTFKV